MNTTIEKVREAVRRDGWIRLPAMGDTEYRQLLRFLGEPWCETAVEVRADVKSYLCQAGAIPFHTDHPRADLMAWRCERQDPSDGTQQLIDGLYALAACQPWVEQALRRITLEVRVRGGDEPESVAVVRDTCLGKRLCFAPWLAPQVQDADGRRAFDTLAHRIEATAVEWTIDVRLEEGEVLVIDNGRMLHGRRAIAPDSDRRLRRFWITLPRTEEAGTHRSSPVAARAGAATALGTLSAFFPVNPSHLFTMTSQ